MSQSEIDQKLPDSFYQKAARQVCKWCAEDNPQIRHDHYGYRHILRRGDSWDESEHVACAAPHLEDFTEQRIAALVSALEDARRFVSQFPCCCHSCIDIEAEGSCGRCATLATIEKALKP